MVAAVLMIVGIVAGTATDKKSYEVGYSIGWSEGACAGVEEFVSGTTYDADDFRDGCIDGATDCQKPGHPNKLNP